jgi:hypothetical protein
LKEVQQIEAWKVMAKYGKHPRKTRKTWGCWREIGLFYRWNMNHLGNLEGLLGLRIIFYFFGDPSSKSKPNYQFTVVYIPMEWGKNHQAESFLTEWDWRVCVCVSQAKNRSTMPIHQLIGLFFEDTDVLMSVLRLTYQLWWPE